MVFGAQEIFHGTDYTGMFEKSSKVFMIKEHVFFKVINAYIF